jgi:hypothetical protein
MAMYKRKFLSAWTATQTKLLTAVDIGLHIVAVDVAEHLVDAVDN